MLLLSPCCSPPPPHPSLESLADCCGPPSVSGGALFFHPLYHVGLWVVLCVSPVLHTSCGVLVESLMCSNVLVQSGSCAGVVTSGAPVTSVGPLRVDVLVHFVLQEKVHVGVSTVDGDGVQVSGLLLGCLVAAVHGRLMLLHVPCFVSFVAVPGPCRFLYATSTQRQLHHIMQDTLYTYTPIVNCQNAAPVMSVIVVSPQPVRGWLAVAALRYI